MRDQPNGRPPRSRRPALALVCSFLGCVGWGLVAWILHPYHPTERLAISNPLTAIVNGLILFVGGGSCVTLSLLGILLRKSALRNQATTAVLLSCFGFVIAVCVIVWRIRVLIDVFDDPYWTGA